MSNTLECLRCRGWYFLLLAGVYLIFRLSFEHSPKDCTSRIQNAPPSKHEHPVLDPDTLFRIKTGRPSFSPDDPELLQHIRSSYLAKPSTLPLVLDNPELVHYSQMNQSQMIDKLLGGRRGGFFVECGAGSGESLSNSLFFERERGWTGLLVEANPWRYEGLLRQHRHSYTLQGCLSTSNVTKAADFHLAPQGGSLEDVASSTLYGVKKNESLPTTQVQCFPLYSILLALGVSHVHYFSLDVEGSELDILKTVPFTALRIDALTVEFRVFRDASIDEEKSKNKLGAIKDLVLQTGLYEYKGVLPPVEKGKDYLGLDAVFVRKDVDNYLH